MGHFVCTVPNTEQEDGFSGFWMQGETKS